MVERGDKWEEEEVLKWRIKQTEVLKEKNKGIWTKERIVNASKKCIIFWLVLFYFIKMLFSVNFL